MRPNSSRISQRCFDNRSHHAFLTHTVLLDDRFDELNDHEVEIALDDHKLDLSVQPIIEEWDH